MTDRGLERRHAFITLSYEEISALAAPAFGTQALIAARPIEGGKVNSNYLLHFQEPSLKAVLRIYARGRHICALERDILLLLTKKSLNAPQILYDGADHDTPYLILSWIPGEPLDQTLISNPSNHEKLGDSVGATLAGIHAITFPEAGFFSSGLTIKHPFRANSVGFRKFVEPALHGMAAARLGPEVTHQLQTLIEWAAPQLDVLPRNTCLIHSDFNPANLRADGGQISGVIDWEFAHAGEPLTDIANLLRPRPYQSDAFNKAFLLAYENIAGPLPENWRPLSRLIDLMAQIEMLNAPDERPNLFRWATERVADTVSYINANLKQH